MGDLEVTKSNTTTGRGKKGRIEITGQQIKTLVIKGGERNRISLCLRPETGEPNALKRKEVYPEFCGLGSNVPGQKHIKFNSR